FSKRNLQLKISGDSKSCVRISIFFEQGSYNNNPIFIEADKFRLTQVISNLLNNAIKFRGRSNNYYYKKEITKLSSA
ncbi:MAG TPA: hypothetical protein VFJ51_09000, partial [Nitrososphaeraceae archaeon]|nr:hypothetical protein [Nitrososphaeraceae archaeon]